MFVRQRRHGRTFVVLLVLALLVGSTGAVRAHDDDHDDGLLGSLGPVGSLDPVDHLLDSPARRGLVSPLGFASHVWAAVPVPTNLEWGPDGRLYVLSLSGQVHAFTPVPGDLTGVGVPFHTGLATTNGLAVDPDDAGTIYLSEWYSEAGHTWGRVLAVSDTTGNGMADTTEVMLDGLPGGQHWVNDLVVHPVDGKLYVTNGNRTDNGITCSSGSCPEETDRPEYPWRAGAILRIDRSARDLDPQDAGVEVVADGMRNVYDVAFWPTDPAVAFTATNGPQDPAGDDLLHRTNVADGTVDDMGFPSCIVGAHERDSLVNELVGELAGDGGHHDHGHGIEPESSPNEEVIARFGECDPDAVVWPVATFGGHVSANGLAFSHGSDFPGTYGNDLFVALWGSLEPSHPLAGHKVARVNLRDDGTVVTDEQGMPWVQEFATGGAPLDVTFGPDGAMYVADNAGLIQRIAWVGGVVPPNDEHDGHGGHDHGHGDHDDGHGDDPCDDEGEEVTRGNGSNNRNDRGNGNGNGRHGQSDGGSCDDGHGHDADYTGVEPDSYASPEHPAYGYDAGTERHHDVMFRRLWGCDVEHPYFAWLVDEVKHHITTKTPDLRAALLAGYTPMSPVPNDFGYPETYWHWWHLAEGPQSHPERSDPSSQAYRDAIVQPHNWIEYLLMVPEHVTHPHRESVNWTVEGVMFAIPHGGPGPNLYEPVEGVQEHPCNPFHDHGGIDNPHFHIWPWHHVHPLAMNPPHLCDDNAEMKDTYWPLRDTWHCVYDGDRNDPDIGAHDPDNPYRDGDGHPHEH